MRRIQIILPDISGKGGTERAVTNLANMLVTDFKIEIVSIYKSTTGNNESYYEVNQNVKIHFLELENLGTIANLRNSYSSLKKNITKSKADFIIGTWYGANILLPFFKNKKTKVIGCEHVSFDTTPKLVKFITKFLYPRLNAIVMLSKIAESKMTSAKNNIHIIPNSLPFTVVETTKCDKNRILTVGRIVEGKGYERLVPVAKYLQEHFKDWSIDVFGDGELKESLEKLYKDEELSNIKINPAVKDIKKEYLSSTIYVSTSYSEAMPMTFLEAMSCGLPVVSYRNEGSETIISDKLDGFLIDSSDEFVERIRCLIENKEKRLEMQRKAIKKSNEYSTSAIKSKWLNLLNSLQ